MSRERRTPILLGESGAQVVRVERSDGRTWIEKSGVPSDIAHEAAVLRWCGRHLPVAQVLEEQPGVLRMSELPGQPLTELPMEVACAVLAAAFHAMHAVPIADCPFAGDWHHRVQQAEERVRAGLVDASDFDEANLGRSAREILEELKAFPPLPRLRCFTHGDACLENFLAEGGRLSGIVDVGRAGVTHPAQDWALALRSMSGCFGTRGEKLLRRYLPVECEDDGLLQRFCLLDELF